ncbi:MAG: outer membrane protein assembly factor BamD [Bacteroidales bacterium]|nr:outer membrane protein assembly factor BamD [Bacteroidales bacterium]MBN2750290.1 outer membrane protein assembly factor BamD [Bacteroidales bacterium]
MSRKTIVLIFLPVILLVSCKGFEKILKSKDYDFKYQKALEYFQKGDHYRYSMLFEQLVPIYKGTQRADTVEYYLALGNYNQGDYLLAGHYFDKFRKTYPRSPFAEEAEFMYAYCFYEMSPRPDLDQETTQAAIAAFSEFISKFPRTSKRQQVLDIHKELKEKLMEKSYLSAKLYYNMSEYKAAIVALKNSLEEYPNTPHREEMLYLIVRSSYLLADNSVPEKRKERFQATIDEYFTFIAEYPESRYAKDAKEMHERSVKVLGI